MPKSTPLSSTSTMMVGSTLVFEDGLQVKLDHIDDSRCKPGVQCIWAGELSPVLMVSEGQVGETGREVRLGTERTPATTESGYRFRLGEVSTDRAEIWVGVGE